MSGGSFNYLCYVEVDALLSGERDESLHDMVDALRAHGAEDAAAETERLLAICEGQRARVTARLERLADLWHAMEWWQSCDTTEDDWKVELEKWREEK